MRPGRYWAACFPVAMSFAIIDVGSSPWRSAAVLAPLAAGLLSLAGLVLAERRCCEPMLSSGPAWNYSRRMG